jgi:glycosyltransferase involved in cell wall biosynthesis
MEKIRLLTISPTCEIGGSELNLLRLLQHLDKDEYEILHLIPYPGPLADEFKKASFQVKILDMSRIRRFINPLKHIAFFLNFFPTVFKIKKIIENNRIDIVCTSSMVNPYGALAARLANKPHVLMVVEYLTVLRITIPYFYLLSDKIICCSNMVSRMFKKSDKVLVYYPGIDINEFSPDSDGKALKEKLGISKNLVGMVTRLAAWKGVEVFIKAAKYLNDDVKFVIFGQPVMGKERYAAKLTRIIEDSGLKDRVTINLEYRYKDIPSVIAASDVLVHASLRPEPFGLTVIEAMAMAKPVIAAKLGGPVEIISDGIDGMLIEPGRPQVLASSILMLLDNPEIARKIGMMAREKVLKKFDIKNYARNFDIIFKSIHKKHYLKMEYSKFRNRSKLL